MKDPIRVPRRTRRIIVIIVVIAAAIVSVAQANDLRVPINLPRIELPEQITRFPGAVLEQQPGLYPVVHISDGDTITVRMPDGKEETIRMLGVDTPETKDPRKPVQCFGEAASRHTKDRLTGKSVRLEPDPTNTDRDKYKRLLRYVYLPDGTLYNAELISEGYAFAYTVFPLVRLEEFRALERQAREQNKGLWAGCDIDDSNKVKQTTSGK